MFTGIVEETGSTVSITPRPDAIRVVVAARLATQGTRTGDSIAVNGCCLTVVAIGGTPRRRTLAFDLLKETWDRTSIGDGTVGSPVNLERALAVGDRIGGHFVTGHIDGTGVITRWERNGNDHVLDIHAPADVRRYVVFKGSIAVDGISLTVADVTHDGFRIWIIPHTLEVTVLKHRKVGDRVNLEADMLGKYVEKFAAAAPTAPPSAPAKRRSKT